MKNTNQLTGKIHSLESCGTVDGPGIRFVVFMQGCPLRCIYCHNADTWDASCGTLYTVDQLIDEILKYKSYMHFSGGGVTFTGGEPLLQPSFIKEVFQECHKEKVHTALDTSGYLMNDKIKELLEFTDLVLLDIKNFDPSVYHQVTGVDLKPTLIFLDYLREKHISTWIRYVLVPSITDNLDNIRELSLYLKDYPNIERIELLPFHKMGEFKWKALGKNYLLKDTPEPDEILIQKVRTILEESGKTVK